MTVKHQTDNGEFGDLPKIAPEKPTTNLRSSHNETSSFGTKTIFGGGKVALWSMSIGMGCVIGIAVATAIELLASGSVHDRTELAIAEGICSFLVAAGLTWIILVDKRTLKGYDQHQEESVENSWIQRSAVYGFDGILLANAVLSVVLTFRDKPIGSTVAQYCLGGCVLIGILSWGIGYLVLYIKGTR
ncbi:hypothetical protein [Bifidobacterium sp. ESL0764]|uniref:hypothetical protein n=1 Tax=Bifidobacterium sp. ESL0764 TaxID=2983228 RepID=UPI0023F91B60|nr:hypothetical protein [Bifidobacterium sp. ESL0764]WEV65078.1 hypothetical protein OZX71_04650 [Bifidobacterium sp. ESL0764]